MTAPAERFQENPDTLSVAFVRCVEEEVTDCAVMTWPELAELLGAVTEGPKAGRAWLAAAIRPGPRKGARVQCVTALVLDIEADTVREPDGSKRVTGPVPPPLGELAAELALLGWRSILHTSHSHSREDPRYRVVFALSRPLHKDEVRTLGLHVAALLGILDAFDKSSFDPARPFYLPRAPRERLGAFEHRTLDGMPLDVDAMLGEARRAQDALRDTSRHKAPPRSGSVITAFNKAHEIGEVLETFGYVAKGRNRWMHPESTTRIPGVRRLPQSDPPRVFSSHGPDPLNDGHAHDAFDCYRILLNDGDMKVAVREAAKLLGMDVRRETATDVPEAEDGEECPIGDEFPDLSHDQLALDLSQRAGWNRSARYVSGWGKWLFWDGARWQQDDKLLHMTEVRRFLRDMAADLSRWAIKKGAEMQAEERGKLVKWAKREARVLRQASTRANVEMTARSNTDLAAAVDLFDANLDVIGTPTGIVDLRTGEIRPADPEDYITKITSVSPAAPGVHAALWEGFLRWAQHDDPEMLAFLKRLCGYALTGHTSEHKLPFLWGPGGNGKSVFANTLFGVMGDYVRRAPAETFLDSQGGRHPTDLAGLRGSRLVIGSELPAGKQWNDSVIKDLTGGDVITARLMRQDFFDYRPQFTLVIVGNHQPSFRGVDDAIRRRVLLIPFIAKIDDKDKDRDLEQKLKGEWPAILRWAIEGAVEWYQHGLRPPQSVIEASDEYLDGEDSIKEFMDEALATDPEGAVPMRDLYRAFRGWSDARGVRSIWTQTALTRVLRERGFPISRRNDGRALLGYRLPQTSFGTSFDEFGPADYRRATGGY